jgi:hypothetical protein
VADRDALRSLGFMPGQHKRENTVFDGCFHLIDRHAEGQYNGSREGAIATLLTMIRDVVGSDWRSPLPLERECVIMDCHVELIRVNTWDLGLEHHSGLAGPDIDGWKFSCCPMTLHAADFVLQPLQLMKWGRPSSPPMWFERHFIYSLQDRGRPSEPSPLNYKTFFNESIPPPP